MFLQLPVWGQEEYIIGISVGECHSIALKNNGTVWSWGGNGGGQLGDGTYRDRSRPVQVVNSIDPTGFLTDVIKIATGTSYWLNQGGHNIALRRDNTVWSWGYNFNGQIGDGDTISRSAPVKVADTLDQTGYLTNVVAIAAGDWHSLAVKNDGTVWGWGANAYGQLGDGTNASRLTVVQTQNLSEIVQVAAGQYHSMALTQQGTLWAWGGNGSGQLGDGTRGVNRYTPVQVLNSTDGFLTSVSEISVGDNHSLVLKTDGTVWAWGKNTSGQLGNNGTADQILPVQVIDPNDLTGYLKEVIAIAAGQNFSVALKADGSVWTWGYNNWNQLGDGMTENRLIPYQVLAISDVTYIAAGNGHVLVVKADGVVWGWGGNWLGQLGDGTTEQRATPVQTLAPGSAPSMPILTSPDDGSFNVLLSPILNTEDFFDPDTNDRHIQTEWQISESNDFSTIVFQVVSTKSLTSLIVPHLVLGQDTTYYWRARFYDNNMNESEWSNSFSFRTLLDSTDLNSNGIPDDLEIEDITVDLDRNGIPDIQQTDIKSMKTVIGNCQIGVSNSIDTNVTDIEAIDSIDPLEVSDLVRPHDMPLGLFAMRLHILNPGDIVSVTVHFCKAAPNEMIWYMYDAVEGWYDYSEYSTYSPDRMSITLELKDGGHGDADGIANRIIVDPCGSGIASFVRGLVFDINTTECIGNAKIQIDDVAVNAFTDGHYLTMLLPGQYSISTYADGYETLFDTIEIPEGFTVTRDMGLESEGESTNLTAIITSPASNTTINAGESITFICSIINGNEPLTFIWNFGGGATNSNQENPGNITFQNVGTYAVSLTVNDADGDTSSDSVIITVLDPPNGDNDGGGGGGGGCFIDIL